MSRKRSFIHYIFSKSPTIAIADHIDATHKHSQAALFYLETSLSPQLSQRLDADWMSAILSTLTVLEKRTSEGWNFGTFFPDLIPIHQQFIGSVDALEALDRKVSLEMRDVEQAIEDWINRHVSHKSD